MINYEVNLEIDNAIYDECFSWLVNHVKEILVFDGFLNAKFFEDVEESQDGYKKLIINYELDKKESLQHYFDNHAAIMRNKTQEAFGDKVKAVRRVLKLNKLIEKHH